ncbi:MAG: DUF3368 domain-containing protein, partial [Nitrosopumilaceae archaeon]|nr:DUF3368 domain-containing protein [Nitrosopumilaceae archaeon]NIX61908.1 DUF3368 domain-containing protein [Nitrosopumilaceae archaeon]
MIVITNSTPLIHLSAINKLFLLKERFGEIFIPPAVYDEVVIQSSEEPGSKEVKDSKWIKSVEVKDRLSIKILNSDLGLGESECIVLAKQLNAE